MNSMIMAESLMVMERNALQFNYALLHDTNIIKMLIPFAKEKISKKGKSKIMEMVNRKSRYYNDYPSNKLRINLLNELGKVYGIPPKRYSTKWDVSDQCDRIINEMYNYTSKTNKKFKRFSNKNNNLNKLEVLLKFQMLSLIDSIGDKEINDVQLKEIGDSLEDFLNRLPEDQQRTIAEKLGINKITSSTIQQLVATNGAAIVFASIVQVAGFAFYTTLTSVVAGIFGIVGITLPFAVYVSLTSAVAVIANPLFFIPIVIAGGGGLLKWQNDKMKKAIAPVILMQIMMSSDQSLNPEWEEFLYE
ncbi:hypothetical protein CYL18_15015 [Pradoshia eiseniae]|uniref:Uncharacterized protein n=1 Tax=Pradoshia eiseniae TaxID=2064768 RepID=A0A2S7MX59_9BACI|nr:hypothetical protein [Pradoshia eiseniae]PQD94340.1 hypothetical protein CYL18_15015 [Pradoshia eiseniae]